jgi:hypothetical protein
MVMVSQIGPLVLSQPGGQQSGQVQQWFFDVGGFTMRSISFAVDAFERNSVLRVDNIRHVLTDDGRRHVLVDVTNVGTVATNYAMTAGLIHPEPL